MSLDPLLLGGVWGQLRLGDEWPEKDTDSHVLVQQSIYTMSLSKVGVRAVNSCMREIVKMKDEAYTLDLHVLD